MFKVAITSYDRISGSNFTRFVEYAKVEDAEKHAAWARYCGANTTVSAA